MKTPSSEEIWSEVSSHRLRIDLPPNTGSRADGTANGAVPPFTVIPLGGPRRMLINADG